MRIRLTKNLPINKRHGAIKGAEFNVFKIERGRNGRAFFLDSNGFECAAYSHEYEFCNTGDKQC